MRTEKKVSFFLICLGKYFKSVISKIWSSWTEFSEATRSNFWGYKNEVEVCFFGHIEVCFEVNSEANSRPVLRLNKGRFGVVIKRKSEVDLKGNFNRKWAVKIWGKPTDLRWVLRSVLKHLTGLSWGFVFKWCLRAKFGGIFCINEGAAKPNLRFILSTSFQACYRKYVSQVLNLSLKTFSFW
jgi:hypothetical protein